MSKKLEGKIAIVTGGSTGIGFATAKEFVAQGAYVYITGRRQIELDEALKAIGSSVTAIRADSSALSDLDKVYEQIKQEKGRIDIVFANAGVAAFAPLGSITEEHFDSIFDINVKGMVFSVQKALPLIPDGGAIILNASITSTKGTAAFSVYSATKAAVRSFARCWTLDLKDRKIRVNVISPGPVETPGLNGLVPEDHKEGLHSALASHVPLGRIGEPEEIGKVVAFLASEEASFIAGAEISVDGGAAQI
jgi:NAD(P)-dependent dehydrogenase (short-subunit alcohol dehydrogenase family)